MRVLFGCVFLLSSLAAHANPWEGFTSPTEGNEQSVGSYSNGCLFGGAALPLRGPGYQVIRPSRLRYFAHPYMVNFLEDLARETQSKGLPDLLVADLSMPRGGQFSSGHKSHQTGLDADIWLSFSQQQLESQAAENIRAKSLVNLREYTLNEDNWQPHHLTLIKTAASDSRTERIFVHPVIKEKLCIEATGHRSWLRKVRPWFGHNYHMHVRLKCPETDKRCFSQAPPPKGDGCGAELISWRPQPGKKEGKPPAKKKRKIKPFECQQLIGGNEN